MKHLPTPHPSQDSDEHSPIDDLRTLAYGERGDTPPLYPRFDFAFLKNSPPKPQRIHVTEKVSVWLDTLGNVVVQWLDALLPPAAGQPVLAMRAANHAEANTRRIIIQSEHTHQPNIELVLHNAKSRSLTVRVGDWPTYMADVRVRVQAGSWQHELATNDEGEVTFTELPNIDIGAVQVELIFGKN